MVNAPHTFSLKMHAESWLVDRKKEIDTALWHPAGAIRPQAVVFSEYSRRWLAERRAKGLPLKPGTQEQYRRRLDKYLLPHWGHRELASITTVDVKSWYAGLLPDAPVQRSCCYRLFRGIMASAYADELIQTDVCRIRGASQSERTHQITPASLSELAVATQAMPPRLQLAVTLSAWLATRFGETTELRRHDVDLNAQVVHIRRAVVHLQSGQFHVGSPKSAAGVRSIAVPPHIIEQTQEHLDNYVAAEPSALLFPVALDRPQEHLPSWTMFYWWSKARKAAGRDDLRWHDLRHTGAVLAAQTGATLAEIMSRLGHSSPDAALRYQHAGRDRDQELASRLSKMAANG
jgi:integrase